MSPGQEKNEKDQERVVTRQTKHLGAHVAWDREAGGWDAKVPKCDRGRLDGQDLMMIIMG